MDRSEQLMTLAGPATDQWGLVTAAQAKKLGLSAVQLKRLTEADLLTNVGRGVYALPAVGLPQHLEIKVAWLRLQPEIFAWERSPGCEDSGVVSHASACQLHNLGDIPAPEVEISVPRRRTTTEPFVRLRTARLEPADITIIDGLPVTSPERTVVDLLHAKADGGHVGGVIADAERRDLVDIDALADRVQPFARRYGFAAAATGHELIEHLAGQAGRNLHFQELAHAGREGFVVGAQLADLHNADRLLGANATAAQVFASRLHSLEGRQDMWEAMAKLMPDLSHFEKVQQALAQILASPSYTELIKGHTRWSGAVRALYEGSMPKSDLSALAEAAQRAVTLSPEVQRAIQQAAVPGPGVSRAIKALQQLEQAPPGRADESGDNDALQTEEEEPNGLNGTQDPE
ncbi:type IV toxin-antitoxin system AbiEi family antitoxin domain-containing protein [Streptomyces sp. NPDC059787]|uniref:type IV toxin-antitoxin system AbiEi family antitoxin domain-containing protein n=1 Tax=Streptomyces sp. NPDC059787 TaxID=3346947 RepID=UPI00365FFDAC